MVISVLLVLLVGTGVSVVVGRVLQQAGRPFLDDVMRDERVSASAARLLAVMFHLIAIGTVALLSTLRLDGVDMLQGTVIKLGLVLVIIGGAHGLTLLGLLRVKKRRREQMLQEGMAERMGRGPARVQPPTA